ncbi:hypothetical protein FACS189441_1980 [Betaproteobacteria bacterium]|nr:hypothetical protein FACS189441_1980 [Betaproteobacteria bacterium]
MQQNPCPNEAGDKELRQVHKIKGNFYPRKTAGEKALCLLLLQTQQAMLPSQHGHGAVSPKFARDPTAFASDS